MVELHDTNTGSLFVGATGAGCTDCCLPLFAHDEPQRLHQADDVFVQIRQELIVSDHLWDRTATEDFFQPLEIEISVHPDVGQGRLDLVAEKLGGFGRVGIADLMPDTGLARLLHDVAAGGGMGHVLLDDVEGQLLLQAGFELGQHSGIVELQVRSPLDLFAGANGCFLSRLLVLGGLHELLDERRQIQEAQMRIHPERALTEDGTQLLLGQLDAFSSAQLLDALERHGDLHVIMTLLVEVHRQSLRQPIGWTQDLGHDDGMELDTCSPTGPEPTLAVDKHRIEVGIIAEQGDLARQLLPECGDACRQLRDLSKRLPRVFRIGHDPVWVELVESPELGVVTDGRELPIRRWCNHCNHGTLLFLCARGATIEQCTELYY